MQQRRLRPGDVLDDYCPRERRITDHAIVAMVDDEIQQTRCVVCDAEHDYKQAKVPPQRKKKTPALFTQVLDGLKAPARPQLADVADVDPEPMPPQPDAPVVDVPARTVAPALISTNGDGDHRPVIAAVPSPAAPADARELKPPDESAGVDGPFRRRLIRAALPRPDGTPPPARGIPEFTIRQPMGRNQRPGGGRGRGQHHGPNGQTRFGRRGHGARSAQGRPGGGHGHGHGNHAPGNRAGGRRGKKR